MESQHCGHLDHSVNLTKPIGPTHISASPPALGSTSLTQCFLEARMMRFKFLLFSCEFDRHHIACKALESVWVPLPDTQTPVCMQPG